MSPRHPPHPRLILSNAQKSAGGVLGSRNKFELAVKDGTAAVSQMLGSLGYSRSHLPLAEPLLAVGCIVSVFNRPTRRCTGAVRAGFTCFLSVPCARPGELGRMRLWSHVGLTSLELLLFFGHESQRSSPNASTRWLAFGRIERKPSPVQTRAQAWSRYRSGKAKRRFGTWHAEQHF